MQEIRGQKGARVRIILLKEAPPRAALYDHHRFSHPMASPFTVSPPKPKVNRTSIAYLSSILQDEHVQTQKATISRFEEEQPSVARAEREEKLQLFQRSGKKSNRYLSSLLETEEGEACVSHAKTEGIEKLLRRRKILPIDKIQQRRKNITFSLKNKRELNHDFNEFVSKRTVTPAKDPEDAKGSETIAFPMKISLERRGTSLRGDKRKGRKTMQHLQLLEPNLPLPPNFLRKNTSSETSKEPGYAIAFKRISSDIPQLDSFEWSRLDQHPYHLARDRQ